MNIDNIKATFQKYWKVALFVLLLLALAFAFFKIQHLEKQVEQDKQTVTVMSSDHAQNQNALQNELDISKKDAQILAGYIKGIQAGTTAPNTSFTVTSSTPEGAVRELVTRIEKQDTTLPKEVYDKTDKTVVTEQPDNKDYQVGVYKINTYRNWEMGTGIGVQNNNWYVPISLQRNYDKNHSIEAEVHIDKDIVNKHISGGAIKWNVHF